MNNYGVSQIVADGTPEHSLCSPGLRERLERHLAKESCRNPKLRRGKYPSFCPNPYCFRWSNDEYTIHYAEYGYLPWRPALTFDPPILLGPFPSSVICAHAEDKLLLRLMEIDVGKRVGGGGGILLYQIYYKQGKYRLYTTEFGVGLGPLIGTFKSKKEAEEFWPKHQDSILFGKTLVMP